MTTDDSKAVEETHVAVESTKIASTFAWRDVSMTVAKGKKQEKQILSNVSGSLSGGQVCALMGPSGAGKTSLLNVLAARIRSRGTTEVAGNITLDGQAITGSSLRKRIAYVMQQDIMVPTQTVRESLWFSANLRLPKTYSMEQKKVLVEKMLNDLGLMKCADTFIGDEMIRGVSGGEKKRTCVGIELIMKPKLIFLDEPTSGLDSYAAHNVILKLEELANKEGCNVLCTIHQPSSEVFHLFNKVMFLRSGKLFFYGGIGGLSEQLHVVGRGCPNEYNLADHVMFLLQTQEDTALDDMQAKMTIELPKAEADVPHDKSAMTKTMEGATAGFFTQLFALTKREAQNIWRDKPGLIASILVPLVLNVFFALIFYQVGDVTLDTYNPQSHFGGMTQVAIGGMFGAAQPLLLKFPLDRGIFLREYATQTYGSAPYFLSKTMVELPQSFLNAVITWTAAYFLMGMRGSFMVYVLVFWITGVAAASTAVLVGCIAANPEVAQQAAPAVFVPQLLFAGFFIAQEQIPDWLSWASYLCALKYGMNLNILNEFGPDAVAEWPDDVATNQGGIPIVGKQAVGEFVNANFIARNSIDTEHVWLYVGILLGIIVVVRLLSILALARRAASFY
mmetsp:Transcript_27255/g.51059  ORF Transcript_27255/g.51059 Transcript_27255/m.51059 type:complete len:619 (-) Transcript_27255:90-1946(-)